MITTLSAYHKHLLSNFHTKELLAYNIYNDIMTCQHQQAFELLELTGDKTFNTETFYKAADLLLNAKTSNHA